MNRPPAFGDRTDIGGKLPQFDVFAWFLYKELLSDNLVWIRVADPTAEKLDDVQYATHTEIHAYQIKWSNQTPAIPFSLNDLKNLLPEMVLGWEKLKVNYASENKKVIVHLLTNRPLSTKDRIALNSKEFANTSEFYSQLWQNIKVGLEPDEKWNKVLEELITLSGLSKSDFYDFVRHFDFNPSYAHIEVRIASIDTNKQQEDLLHLSRFIIEEVAAKEQTVHFTINDLIKGLGGSWQLRFKTTFNHEIVIDKSKYQPIEKSVSELDKTLSTISCGYLFLLGGPGTGKSTLLTQWSRGRKERIVRYYAFDFSNPSSMHNKSERGESINLLFDLVFQLKATGIPCEKVLPYRDVNYLRTQLENIFQSISDDYKSHGRKTIIIIDGLDHIPREYKAVSKSFLAELPHPASIPEGLYIILGSQSYELADISQDIKSEFQKKERVISISPLGKKQIIALINSSGFEGNITSTQVQRIIDLSQGHPLYLSYLLERMRRNGIKDDLLLDMPLINGQIDVYYTKIWETIAGRNELVELLGMICRIRGVINPKFIEEWSFDKQVFSDFRKSARFLFEETESTWSFFHNSFRQFLYYKTAGAALTLEFDEEASIRMHKSLAVFYDGSKIEPHWKSDYHLYQSGSYETFIAKTSPEYFIDQLLNFRPFEEIEQDITFGIWIATKWRDEKILTKYLFCLAELSRRSNYIDPSQFVEEFLSIGKVSIAKEYIRSGRSLRKNSLDPLEAANHFYKHNHRSEANLLFNLGEPDEIGSDRITISDIDNEEGSLLKLKNWINIAHHYYPLNHLLNLLNNIAFKGERSRHHTIYSIGEFRAILLGHLAMSLISNNRWSEVERVLGELKESQDDSAMNFQVYREAILFAGEEGDLLRASDLLGTLIQNSPLEKCDARKRVLIADLIFRVTKDLKLVELWIQGLTQPNLDKDRIETNDDFNTYSHKIRYNKLLNLLGRGMNIVEIVPILPHMTAEQKLSAEFERMLYLIVQIQTDGILGIPVYDLEKRIKPILDFFYQSRKGRNMFWYSVDRMKVQYFDFLIHSVSISGLENLIKLGNIIQSHFEAKRACYDPSTQREIILSLWKNGYDINHAVAVLNSIEEDMLWHCDIDGRIQQCSDQARAWLQIGNNDKCEELIKRAIKESIGVGYRKDYQFSAWTLWLKRVNKIDELGAPERIKWFLSIIETLRGSAESPAYLSTSEQVLEAAFELNFAGAVDQMQWQLNNGLIHLEDALEIVVKEYIRRASNDVDFSLITSLYIELVLLIADSPSIRTLELILSKGYELLKDSFFEVFLPKLIDGIKINALEEYRYDLLASIKIFVDKHNRNINDMFPDLQMPERPSDYSSGEHKNVLKLMHESKELSEEEVVARASSYNDLCDCILSESDSSYFDWSEVLMNLKFNLSPDQILHLADIKKGHHRSDFLSLLSGIACDAKAPKIAHLLALKAVEQSSTSGWMKEYDGGSRINAFLALSKVNENESREKAFDVFSHDILSTSYSLNYIESLDDILPLLNKSYNVLDIWEIVFEYLKRLMTSTSKEEDLPDFTMANDSLAGSYTKLLIFLAQMPPVLVYEKARMLIAECICYGVESSIDTVRQLATSDEKKQELFIDILMRVQCLNKECVANFGTEVERLAVSPNYTIRMGARFSLKQLKIALPQISKKALPPVYSIHFSPNAGKKFAKESFNLHEAYKLTSPFSMWISFLNNFTGITIDNITFRIYELMKTLDLPQNWDSNAEKNLRRNLEDIGLNYPFPKPQNIIAQRALVHVLGELLDSHSLQQGLADKVFVWVDYFAYLIKATAIPKHIPRISQGRSGYVGKEWVSNHESSNRFTERLIDHQGYKIIGEYSLVKTLDWDLPTETYMAQLATGANIHDERGTIFDRVFQVQTSEYYSAEAEPPSIIIENHNLTIQHSMRSRWIAFNPSLAKFLNWVPDHSKQFGWKDFNGESMIASFYWSNGNLEMRPPKRQSEVGEGWVVLASQSAINKIREATDSLAFQQKVERSKFADQILVENHAYRVIPNT